MYKYVPTPSHLNDRHTTKSRIFPFLQLPYELRLQVYQLLLPPIQTVITSNITLGHLPSGLHALYLLNTQLSTEILPLIYSHLSFPSSRSVSALFGTERYPERRDYAEYIRSITLDLSSNDANLPQDLEFLSYLASVQQAQYSLYLSRLIHSFPTFQNLIIIMPGHRGKSRRSDPQHWMGAVAITALLVFAPIIKGESNPIRQLRGLRTFEIKRWRWWEESWWQKNFPSGLEIMRGRLRGMIEGCASEITEPWVGRSEERQTEVYGVDQGNKWGYRPGKQETELHEAVQRNKLFNRPEERQTEFCEADQQNERVDRPEEREMRSMKLVNGMESLDEMNRKL
jgi:hypothetical protein